MDESIRFWDMATGGLIDRLNEGVGWVKTIAFSPDGRHVATAAEMEPCIFSTPTPKASETNRTTFKWGSRNKFPRIPGANRKTS